MTRRTSILLAVAVVFLLAAGAGFFARDKLATALVAFMLDRQPKLECTHPVVSVSATFGTWLLSPFSCKVHASPIASFATESDLRVDMRGFWPSRMEVERATIDKRERDLSHVGMNTLQDLAGAVGVTDEMVKSMLDGSEQYASDNPELLVTALTVKRAGKKLSVSRDYRQLRDGVWNRTQSAVIDSGSGLATVSDLDMRVTPSRARATVGVSLGKHERGSAPDFKLELTGEQLDTRTPRVQLHLR